MTEKFMLLVAKALYVLILIGLTDNPYLREKVNPVLMELEEFYNLD